MVHGQIEKSASNYGNREGTNLDSNNSVEVREIRPNNTILSLKSSYSTGPNNGLAKEERVGRSLLN